MKKIIEYLMIFLLSGTFLIFGKVFVYMLGDEHAFGDSAPFNFSYFLYYIVALYIIYLGVKRLGLNNRSKTNKVLDITIFILYVTLVYLLASTFISRYVVYFV
ncbi:hypothetical protein [Brevibacillus porteri]|uniref:Uncharacterized protein n=1 Tax=Brevibacillus porteri TaxID=2126350 RepID=A0ABX5FU24_9BACL|nr:hypothetical protein [Brevibacillus porteri]MED1801845.1 hypothetical protein [Brevibacillus porteri]MED2134978.1 hypothetical protein [Brevibacillus porteri]MED2745498.1 hypothetical protein [Brevibacillus porteri]MED2815757.1 hypothetical protein [Brevibacillus porteri]MED2897594.1 hypothetical protein [Brevibacillus porteri]